MHQEFVWVPLSERALKYESATGICTDKNESNHAFDACLYKSTKEISSILKEYLFCLFVLYVTVITILALRSVRFGERLQKLSNVGQSLDR
jgi:hypothetical protein